MTKDTWTSREQERIALEEVLDQKWRRFDKLERKLAVLIQDPDGDLRQEIRMTNEAIHLHGEISELIPRIRSYYVDSPSRESEDVNEGDGA